MNPAFSDYGLKDLLPLRLKDPDEGCTRLNRSQYCFDAGTYRHCFFRRNVEMYITQRWRTRVIDGLWWRYVFCQPSVCYQFSRRSPGERTACTRYHAHSMGQGTQSGGERTESNQQTLGRRDGFPRG